MPELSAQIVEYASQHGRVTIGDMVTLTVTSRNTPKQHFRALLIRVFGPVLWARRLPQSKVSAKAITVAPD